MKKNEKKEFLIETDILLNHLINTKNKSLSDLEILMQKGMCFTTVINAAELLFNAVNPHKKEYILDLLNALKVLGLHSRYSLLVNQYYHKVKSYRDALICVVSELNKLPIITNDKRKYINSDLQILSIDEI